MQTTASAVSKVSSDVKRKGQKDGSKKAETKETPDEKEKNKELYDESKDSGIKKGTTEPTGLGKLVKSGAKSQWNKVKTGAPLSTMGKGWGAAAAALQSGGDPMQTIQGGIVGGRAGKMAHQALQQMDDNKRRGILEDTLDEKYGDDVR